MTLTTEGYEGIIDRMNQEIERLRKALDLESKMRKAAVDIADARMELIEEALCSLDECYPYVDDERQSRAVFNLFRAWGHSYYKASNIPLPPGFNDFRGTAFAMRHPEPPTHLPDL